MVYWRPMGSAGMSASQIQAALVSAPIFGALRDEQRQELANASMVRTLAAGESLWRRGEVALHLGLVMKGRLKIQRADSAREVLLDLGLPGAVLGEVAFTLGASYQSDAIALRKSEVLLVPARALRKLLEKDPQVAIALALDLAGQVLRLQRVAQDLSAGSVERRLTRVLLRLVETVGEPFPGGTLVPLRLRRTDLAALAATTLESASRQMSRWQKSGWVVAQPIGYLVKDLAALRKFADQP